MSTKVTKLKSKIVYISLAIGTLVLLGLLLRSYYHESATIFRGITLSLSTMLSVDIACFVTRVASLYNPLLDENKVFGYTMATMIGSMMVYVYMIDKFETNELKLIQVGGSGYT
jgi:hypothetical protein